MTGNLRSFLNSLLAPQLQRLRGFFADASGKAKVAVVTGAASAGALVILTGMLMNFEGFSSKAYPDPIGILTICYGETENVREGDVKTKAECDAMLEERAGYYLAFVKRTVKTELSDQTSAALASFVYNVGPRPFLHSTMLKKLNAGDIAGGCRQLTQACGKYGCHGFVYAYGRILPGLVKRRKKEEAVCLAGI